MQLHAKLFDGMDLVTPKAWAQIEHSGTVGVDFETFYDSTYSVSRLGVWAYCQDPRFNAYLMAVSDGTRTCVCHPNEFLWESIAERIWVSHHRDFDLAVFRRLLEIGIIPKNSGIPSEWNCSAALCAYLQFSRDLAGAVRDVFGVTLDKAPRAHAKGRNPLQSDLNTPEMERYAASDAVACLALWNRLERHWPAQERRLFELTSEMGRYGLPMDWHYVSVKRQDLETSVTRIADSLPWKPPMSLKQFAEACERINVPPPTSTAGSDPRFCLWLTENGNSQAATWVRSMQRVRSANRTAKVLKAMETRRMSGGRMTYELKYFGASTGRWAGGGGLNLQNLNRKAAEGVDLRQSITAPPGFVLATADYSQIENRVLLYLAGDKEALNLFAQSPEADAYEIHARRTMGYSETTSLKNWCGSTGSNLRQLAKARVLGLGFGCGWRKFIDVARVMAGLDLGEAESRRIVRDFRNSNTPIVELWGRLEAACSACHGSHYALPLPSTQQMPELKRFLLYRNVNEQDGQLTATVSGERMDVYGGLLAENWTQATARDVLASAWLRCTEAGFIPVLSVHDELVFELPAANAEQDLARIIEIMETPLPWASNLPLKVDGKLMDSYTK